MKTLAREECRAAIQRRIRTVRPESAARWGRMSAHQMICHLSDGCRMALGEKAVSAAPTLFERTVLKGVVLYAPVRWPSGIPTSPEIDQLCGGTPPASFAADVAELHTLLEGLTRRDEGSAWARHPVFGRMSRAAWLRWSYLHADHHLRQFGT